MVLYLKSPFYDIYNLNCGQNIKIKNKFKSKDIKKNMYNIKILKTYKNKKYLRI